METDLRAVIRAGLDSWSHGDLEGALANLAPDLEFVTSGVYPGLEPVYHGHEGFARFWSEFREAWQDITIEIDQIVEGRQDRYAVVGRFRATGRDGIPAERPVAMQYTIAGDVVKRIESVGSGAEALAAAGL